MAGPVGPVKEHTEHKGNNGVWPSVSWMDTLTPPSPAVMPQACPRHDAGEGDSPSSYPGLSQCGGQVSRMIGSASMRAYQSVSFGPVRLPVAISGT